MGDLRDQLKKAKLLSEKRARRLAHEARVHRSDVGREGTESEARARHSELAKMRAAERERTRAAQAEVEAERQRAAELSACRDILDNEVHCPRGRGNQRWHFELADGRLPWFDVEESLCSGLQSGKYWVVRVGPEGAHDYGLLAADLGRRVHAALPGRVVWAPGGLPRA